MFNIPQEMSTFVDLKKISRFASKAAGMPHPWSAVCMFCFFSKVTVHVGTQDQWESSHQRELICNEPGSLQLDWGVILWWPWFIANWPGSYFAVGVNSYRYNQIPICDWCYTCTYYTYPSGFYSLKPKQNNVIKAHHNFVLCVHWK